MNFVHKVALLRADYVTAECKLCPNAGHRHTWDTIVHEVCIKAALALIQTSNQTASAAVLICCCRLRVLITRRLKDQKIGDALTVVCNMHSIQTCAACVCLTVSSRTCPDVLAESFLPCVFPTYTRECTKWHRQPRRSLLWAKRPMLANWLLPAASVLPFT